MNSSGIKRGLAVAAISALAVTGVPALANAATLTTQETAATSAVGVTLRSLEDGGVASVAPDGTNNTISLVATGGTNVEYVSFFQGTVSAANRIATVSRSANGDFQTEWTPAVGVSNTDVIAVRTDAAGNPAAGNDATSSDTATGVAISGTAATVEIAPKANLGYFPQPNGGDYTTPANVAGLSGTTSQSGGTLTIAPESLNASGAAISLGAIAAGSNSQNWNGTVEVGAGALAGDNDQFLPVVETSVGNTRDAQGFNLYAQQIASITATAAPVLPDSSTTTVTVTVLDQNGQPVAGAKVEGEGSGFGTASNGGFTNGLGQVTFTGAQAGTRSYYVEASNEDGFTTGVDFRASVTTTGSRPTTITATAQDGASFDFDEYDATDDIRVRVVDAAGNPLAGQRFFYKWAFDAFNPAVAAVTGPERQAAVTDAQGYVTIALPTSAADLGVTDPAAAAALNDELGDGDAGGAFTLTGYVNRDGSNPGQDPVDLALDPFNVKVGEAEAAWEGPNAPGSSDAQIGSTQTFKGSLELADGTPLAGRTLNVTYSATGNSVLAATQPTGTTRLSNTSATVVTGANGEYSVAITDPATAPAPETGTLTVTGTASVGSGATLREGVGTDATDTVTINFIADATPFAIISGGATPLIDGIATPGRPVRVSFAVTNAAGAPLRGQSVELSIDEGFFTTDAASAAGLEPAAAPAQGALYGAWRNLGKTITVTTDGFGFATATVAIERSEGFDDNGEVTSLVTAKAGTVTSNDPNSTPIRVNWDSISPLNGKDLVVEQSDEQTVSILPKAPTNEQVAYDIRATDQFGNLVEDENVDVSVDLAGAWIDDETTPSKTVDSSVLADKRAFWLGSEEAGDATPEGSWTTSARTYYDTDTLTPGFQAGVRNTTKVVEDEGETVEFYEIDYAASTYKLSNDTNEFVPVGSTVLMTYKAVDQNGEPISGHRVEFFRTGPNDGQTGEESRVAITNQDGEASYVFAGTEAGVATVEVLMVEGALAGDEIIPESRAKDTVRFGGVIESINAKLNGKSNGAAADKLKVSAGNANAEGAAVKVFKLNKNGKRVLVGKGVLNANGKLTLKVADKNGNAKTRYIAKVAKTDLTKGDTTNIKAVR